MANKIQILDNDHRSITEHARLFKKGEHSTHWVDFVDIVVNRPRALKYSGFYFLLQDNWRMYINTLDDEALKEALRFLRECLVEKDMSFAIQVLEENMLNGVTEPDDALWTTYYRLLEDKALYQGVDASGVLPLLPNYKTSLEDYDSLIGVLTDDG